MSIEVIQGLIASLGFPMFVAIYFMIKNSKDIERLTEVINRLEQTLILLKEKIQ